MFPGFSTTVRAAGRLGDLARRRARARWDAAGQALARQVDGPRRTLLLLVGAAVLPMLLVGGWVGYVSAAHTRAETGRRASQTVTRAAAQIGADVAAELDIARALAASTALDATDAGATPALASFRTEAMRVQAEHGLWHTVELARPDGTQVLNLLRPAGQALGPTADQDSLARVVKSHLAVVGGIGPVGPVSGRRLVTLRVPVIRAGTLRYVLSIAMAPDSIGDLLRRAGAPSDWVGVVVDATGRIVARTLGAGSDVGMLASADLRDAIAHAPDGVLLGRTLENVPAEMVYRTLPGCAGWTIGFAIPIAHLQAPVRRALVLLAAEGVAGLMLAALLTSTVAREIGLRRREEAERAAHALDASEESRALAIEAADLGVWSWTEAGDLFEPSSRCRSMLGIDEDPDGLSQMAAGSVFRSVDRDDLATLRAAMRDCLVCDVALDLEMRVNLPTASTRWVRLIGRRQIAGPRCQGPSGGWSQARQANAGPVADPVRLQGVIADVTEHHRIEAERLDLLRGLALAQEEDRRRIARELHDQVGQTVTGLSIGLKTLDDLVAGRVVDAGVGPLVHERLAWMRTLVAGIGQDIHRAASDLRPTALDDVGLQPALLAFAGSWRERHGIDVDVQTIGTEERLPPEIETVVYRVVQEAMTNVLKHAGARTVSILLERGRAGVRLIVEDDGAGFVPTEAPAAGPPRLGLSGIRERLRLVGGRLELETAPGAGTTLFVTIPIDHGPVERVPSDPALLGRTACPPPACA